MNRQFIEKGRVYVKCLKMLIIFIIKEMKFNFDWSFIFYKLGWLSFISY